MYTTVTVYQTYQNRNRFIGILNERLTLGFPHLNKMSDYILDNLCIRFIIVGGNKMTGLLFCG